MIVTLLPNKLPEKLDEMLKVRLILLALQYASWLTDTVKVIIDFLQVGLQELVLLAGSFELLGTVLIALYLKNLHLVG